MDYSLPSSGPGTSVRNGWSNGGEYVLPENGRTGGSKDIRERMVLDP